MNLKGGYILHDLNWAAPASAVNEGDEINDSHEAYQLYLAIKSRVPIIINLNLVSVKIGEDVYVLCGVMSPVVSYEYLSGGGAILYMNAVSLEKPTAHIVVLEINSAEEPSVETGTVGKANAIWHIYDENA